MIVLARSLLEMPVHPPLVHFPVAFLLTAGAITLAHHITGRSMAYHVGDWLLMAGVASYPIVVLAGIRDAGWAELFTEWDWAQPLPWHVLLALSSIVVSVVWLAARRWLANTITVRADCILAGATIWILLFSGMLAGEVVYS